MNRPLSRVEHMREEDRADEALRNRQYVGALRDAKNAALCIHALTGPRRLARTAAVEAIGKLIRAAEDCQ